MFTLFCNLYYAMFTGTYYNYTWYWWVNDSKLVQITNAVGKFLTSIFGDGQMTDLGEQILDTSLGQTFLLLLSVILATITSIGIVVMAVKGVKKAFGIFFMGIRR